MDEKQPNKSKTAISVLSILGIISSLLIGLIYIVVSLSSLLALDTYISEGSTGHLTEEQALQLLDSLGATSLLGDDPMVGFTALCLVVGTALVFGCAIAIFTLVAAIKGFRSNKHVEKRFSAYVLNAISAFASLLTLRVLSLVIFGFLAFLLYREYRKEHPELDEQFKESDKLGFMRIIEAFCMLSLLFNAVSLMFVTKSSEYDMNHWVGLLELLMLSVTLWLIWKRKEHGREIIMGMALVYIVVNTASMALQGKFSVSAFLLDNLLQFVVLVYFGTSRRVQSVLVEPFSLSKRSEELEEDEKLYNLKSPQFWRNMLLYFCIFSVVGHWMEYGVCWFIRLGIVPGTYDPNSGIWRDLLNPFFVYGIGFCACGILLFPIKNFFQEKFNSTIVALILSFVVNTLVCAVIELAMGFAVNADLQLWDYSNMFCNFMGQICLLNTSFFGLTATVMTWLVYPNIEKMMAKIPRDSMNILTVVVVVFFILLVVMYVINLNVMPAELLSSLTS